MGQRRNLQGLRMLVTGASQGIGRSLVIEGLKAGMDVIAVARKQDLLDELVKDATAKGSTSGRLITVAGDVTDPAGRVKMLETAKTQLGGLDILVNNAGIGATGHFAEEDNSVLRKIFEVNVFGLTETTRVFLPMIKAGKTPAIVNISSIAGLRGIPARAAYSSSKFAVEGFSEALRAELFKDKVDVLVVCPGLTQTNFSQNMLERKAKIQMDHKRGMTADEVALETLESMRRGRERVLLTRDAKRISFITKFFPRIADRIAKRKVAGLFKEEMINTKKGIYPSFLG